jgi:DNA repair protein RadC
MKAVAKSQEAAPYAVERKEIQRAGEDAVIAEAMAILKKRLVKEREAFHSPAAVKQYLALCASARADQNVEIFSIMFVDSQNRLIALDEMFKGTLTQCSVYPREVVRAALAHNAAAVVLTHNHPSGSVQPSRADEHLTQTLKASLALVDVRVLDHIITGPGGMTLSMAEQGLM